MKPISNPKILLIGTNKYLGQALPELFAQAGFAVDAIVLSGALFRKSKFINDFLEAGCVADLLQKIDQTDLRQYSLVVPFDDIILKKILTSDLKLEKKLKLLPVMGEKYFSHLGSKINLSQILQNGRILTPEFSIVKNRSQLSEAAEKIGFPAMLKIDFSGGGEGVFECQNFSDFEKIDEQLISYPTLLQKKIDGTEIDLSAFYQEGKLIYFCYATSEKLISKFGPAFLRTYKQLSQNCSESLFNEMQNLGKVLGANGFVNISAIQAKDDGEIYFFEADMRPNIWVNFTRFVGDNPSLRIKNWFEKKQVMSFPFKKNHAFSDSVLVPHFLRINFFQIFCNYKNVWKFMSANDWRCFFWLNFNQKIHQFLISNMKKIGEFFIILKGVAKKLKQDTRKERNKVKAFFRLDKSL